MSICKNQNSLLFDVDNGTCESAFSVVFYDFIIINYFIFHFKFINSQYPTFNILCFDYQVISKASCLSQSFTSFIYAGSFVIQLASTFKSFEIFIFAFESMLISVKILGNY
jgi:hypothetical protein